MSTSTPKNDRSSGTTSTLVSEYWVSYRKSTGTSTIELPGDSVNWSSISNGRIIKHLQLRLSGVDDTGFYSI